MILRDGAAMGSGVTTIIRKLLATVVAGPTKLMAGVRHDASLLVIPSGFHCTVNGARIANPTDSSLCQIGYDISTAS